MPMANQKKSKMVLFQVVAAKKKTKSKTRLFQAAAKRSRPDPVTGLYLDRVILSPHTRLSAKDRAEVREIVSLMQPV